MRWIGTLSLLLLWSAALAWGAPRSGMNLPGGLPLLAVTFCGEGAIASTNRYLGPASSMGAGVLPGSGNCNNLGGDTAAAVDELVFSIDAGYTVKGMNCQLNSGTDDMIVMTLMDDTVATPVTCTITAAGGIESCRVKVTIAVAEGSLMSVLADAEDDDLSAQDFLCHVFITF